MSTAAACLAGDWTIHTIAQHREGLLQTLAEGRHAFDASGITDLDTAGLQLLMALQRSLAQQGHELQLLQPSSVVRDVLGSYGLDSTLQAIHEPEDAA